MTSRSEGVVGGGAARSDVSVLLHLSYCRSCCLWRGLRGWGGRLLQEQTRKKTRQGS